MCQEAFGSLVMEQSPEAHKFLKLLHFFHILITNEDFLIYIFVEEKQGKKEQFFPQILQTNSCHELNLFH